MTKMEPVLKALAAVGVDLRLSAEADGAAVMRRLMRADGPCISCTARKLHAPGTIAEDCDARLVVMRRAWRAATEESGYVVGEDGFTDWLIFYGGARETQGCAGNCLVVRLRFDGSKGCCHRDARAVRRPLRSDRSAGGIAGRPAFRICAVGAGGSSSSSVRPACDLVAAADAWKTVADSRRV